MGNTNQSHTHTWSRIHTRRKRNKKSSLPIAYGQFMYSPSIFLKNMKVSERILFLNYHLFLHMFILKITKLMCRANQIIIELTKLFLWMWVSQLTTKVGWTSRVDVVVVSNALVISALNYDQGSNASRARVLAPKNKVT